MKLLLVDDDTIFANTAARVMSRHGFEPLVAHDIASALRLADVELPYAVVDLMLGNESGLALVSRLREINRAMRIIVLTGYASIATAVEAVKRGADDYLTKPADAKAIITALRGERRETETTNEPRLSVERLEWEHIQRVLAEHDGNVSATARALNMHRRTLQRKLTKRPASR